MKQHATPAMLKTWLHYSQIEFLRVLLRHAPELGSAFKLQGGNALRLGWGSRRFSEDLDLLLDERRIGDLEAVMPDLRKEIERGLRANRACGPVWVDIKTRSRKPDKKLLDFCITTGNEVVLGCAKLKLEFWPVSSAYLENYESRRSTLGNRLQSPIEVGTLDSLYHDKLAAICGRTHFKAKDLYDLWWISRESRCEIDEKRFLSYLVAYNFDMSCALKADRLILEAGRSPEALDNLKYRLIENLHHWLPNSALMETTARDFHDMALGAVRAVSAIYSTFEAQHDFSQTFSPKPAPRFA